MFDAIPVSLVSRRIFLEGRQFASTSMNIFNGMYHDKVTESIRLILHIRHQPSVQQENLDPLDTLRCITVQ